MPCHSQRIVCSSRTGLIGGNHPASVSHLAAENKSAAATTNAVAAKLPLLLGQFCEQGRVNSDERQGTWADATWAIRFYEKNGYRLLSRNETEPLLRQYWSVPDRQITTSVVLANATWEPANKPAGGGA